MILIWNTEKSMWVTENTTIMDSSVCVLKGLVAIIGKSIYGSVSVKKFRNRKKGIYGYEIIANYF